MKVQKKFIYTDKVTTISCVWPCLYTCFPLSDGTYFSVFDLCTDNACQCGRIQLSLSARPEDCRTRLKRIQQEIGCCFRRGSQHWYGN